MMTILPSDQFIVAALDELITDTQNLLDAAVASKPVDKDECKFWRSQRTAYVNAQGDWLDGLHPLPTPTGYILRSASHPGQTHRAWKVGGIWTCSCHAGDRGIFHRHTALISAIERACELEALEEDAAEQRLSKKISETRAAYMRLSSLALTKGAPLEAAPLYDMPPAARRSLR